MKGSLFALAIAALLIMVTSDIGNGELRPVSMGMIVLMFIIVFGAYFLFLRMTGTYEREPSRIRAE